MRSVADTLREDDERAVAQLSQAQRVELALRLGAKALAVYMAHHGVDEATARRHFRAQNQIGRRRSACLQDDPS
jgi:hypothetical protein